MSDPLYGKAVLRLAADAHGAGRLVGPHVTGSAHNPACGDRVVFDLALSGGRVAEIAQETKACVLTQASASILGQHLRGLGRDEVASLRAKVRAMLEGGPVPGAPFDGFAALAGAATYPSRHRCVLLPFEAALAAFDASEPSQPETVGR